MKIFVSRPIPEIGVGMLKDKGYEVVVNSSAQDRASTKEELLNGAKGADAILATLSDKMDADIMDAGLPTLKIIANFSVGFNHVDMAAAKQRNIFVTNASEGQAEAVAEHTLGLIIMMLHRMPESERYVRADKWHSAWKWDFMLGEGLMNKTLGIVGPGHIGSRVSELAKAFGMNVIMCGQDDDLNAFLPKCDVVSLHVPLLDSTNHLMNEARFKLMKPTAYLVNTARGPIVDEDALLNALKNETIKGAALDVFDHEPNINPELMKLENFVFTPHTASASIEARVAMAKTAASNIIEALEGRTPPNLVK